VSGYATSRLTRLLASGAGKDRWRDLCAMLWRERGVLVVRVNDDALAWDDRELVRAVGERMYGRQA
jgi:hypothetical protein